MRRSDWKIRKSKLFFQIFFQNNGSFWLRLKDPIRVARITCFAQPCLKLPHSITEGPYDVYIEALDALCKMDAEVDHAEVGFVDQAAAAEPGEGVDGGPGDPGEDSIHEGDGHGDEAGNPNVGGEHDLVHEGDGHGIEAANEKPKEGDADIGGGHDGNPGVGGEHAGGEEVDVEMQGGGDHPDHAGDDVDHNNEIQGGGDHAVVGAGEAFGVGGGRGGRRRRACRQ